MRDFQRPGRSITIAENGMAATSHPLASKVAIQMLEQGGNAVDAAISAAVLLGICEPQMTGIGGDCFVLVKPAGDENVIGLNGSGRAPAGIDAAALRSRGDVIDPRSADAVTVPGAVDAFIRLAKDHGKLGIKTCLAPAIHYAEQGVPVAPRVAFDWALAADTFQGTAKDDYLFAGQAPAPGQIFRAPKQAEALRRIAMDGRKGFYEGEVAEDMVAALQAMGGSHTLDDFAAHSSDYVEPVTGSYGGFDLIEMPPNGQGATAILMANIMSHFDLRALDPSGADRTHLEAEAAKLAYDARNRFIADPAASAQYLDHMLSPETAKRLADLIDMDRAMEGPAALAEAVHRDTIYLTVVDRDRMAVSLIYSIFHSFGCGIASDTFGILFQNRGSGFTLTEGHPNEAGPGKRPMHTIIPAMLRRNGRIEIPFGVMGGQYQSAGHVRFLTNIADYGMDPQTAIDAPRAFPQEGRLDLERGHSEAVRETLAARGHTLATPEIAIGGAQAIRIDHEGGVLWGASDPRKDGCALGY